MATAVGNAPTGLAKAGTAVGWATTGPLTSAEALYVAV